MKISALILMLSADNAGLGVGLCAGHAGAGPDRGQDQEAGGPLLQSEAGADRPPGHHLG